MFKQLIEDKIGTVAAMGDGIDKILNSDQVSVITEENKPFRCEISPNEIGLANLQVNSPIHDYKGVHLTCRLRKIPIKRMILLNKPFNELEQQERDVVLIELLPLLKEHFSHIYEIIEQRQNFIAAGYVNNYIDYICYGNKVGF